MLQGSGDMRLQSVGAGVQMNVNGSGATILRDVRGPMHVDGMGSGDVTARSLNGPRLDVESGGSMSVRIESGEVGRMRVDSHGSASVDFGGHVGVVEAGQSWGGARRIRVRAADRVEDHGNGRNSVVITGG